MTRVNADDEEKFTVNADDEEKFTVVFRKKNRKVAASKCSALCSKTRSKKQSNYNINCYTQSQN